MLIALRVQTFTNDRKTRSQNQLTRHQTYTLKTYMYRRSLCRISNKKEKKKKEIIFLERNQGKKFGEKTELQLLVFFFFPGSLCHSPKIFELSKLVTFADDVTIICTV